MAGKFVLLQRGTRGASLCTNARTESVNGANTKSTSKKNGMFITRTEREGSAVGSVMIDWKI